jgi:hypothetical protein
MAGRDESLREAVNRGENHYLHVLVTGGCGFIGSDLFSSV